MPNQQFLERMVAYSKWGHCIKAGVQVYEDGPDIAIENLRTNDMWGAHPWPAERLRAACLAGLATVSKVFSENPPKVATPKFAAAHIIGPAIADVLGVRRP